MIQFFQEVAMKKQNPLCIIAHKLRINSWYPSDCRNRYTPRTSNISPCRINFTVPVDKARHDRMVALVTQMFDLNKRLQGASLDHDKDLLQRQVEEADAAIDNLVYDLYGLTEGEIGIVEAKH